MVLALGITLAFAASVSLTRAAPSWWTNPRDNDATRALATEVENAAVSQLYLARSQANGAPPEGTSWASEDWRVALHEEHINAWLAARLPRWLEGQPGVPEWPDDMSQLQVRFEPDAVRAGVRVDTQDGHRFLTASFKPEIDDRGALWLTASWIHVGRLPVPASWVIGSETRPDGALPAELIDTPEAAAMLSMIQGKEPMLRVPLLDLEDNRRVRLLDVRVKSGRVELTMRTETRATVR